MNQKINLDHWSPPMPPKAHTEDGDMRRIGVELEMIGLEVAEVAQLVRDFLGGSIKEKSQYEHCIEGDDAGDWQIELDYAYLKEKGKQDGPDSEAMAMLDEAAETVVRTGAEMVVPVEVVSPPLPLPRLADVQQLIGQLRQAGAKGTDASMAYAFGMQFNPELPALDAKTIVSYLKAFFCLSDWLKQQSKLDITRWVTGYSADFPASYVRKVIDTAYWPDLATFIDDYLEANPTRNRSLDMLPLIMHLDEKRLRAVVSDDRVKPRPTLHYRLPNCQIDQEHWGVHLAWCDWLQVEHLAVDEDRLNTICRCYAPLFDQFWRRWFVDWGKKVKRWLKPVTAL